MKIDRERLRFEINMSTARRFAELSTCDRAHVGAVIYDPATKRIMGMGYNGALAGHDHCDDVGHLMQEGHCVRTAHAEVNALRQVADAKGCIAFVTHYPCVNCAKELIQRGIRAVVYENDYRISEAAEAMFEHEMIVTIPYEQVWHCIPFLTPEGLQKPVQKL